MTERMRVAFTGGEGLIAGIVRERLPSAFEPRWLTRAEADVSDLEALERAFAGMDAVVHLAANAENDARWDELLLTADVRFAIVNGVSENRGRWLGLDEGRRVLGWEPLDGIA